jgi:glutaminyl-peptide cyclotransferase
MTFQVESQVQRDVLGFTEGFEVHEDKLFESTGSIDGTRLTTIDPKTGKVTELVNFHSAFFGEGLTILKDQIYQLSWQDYLVVVYDLTGKPLRIMRNMHDGWGLTNDGTNLIFTDGKDQLYYADPANFRVLRQVSVRTGNQLLRNINELEMVDGKIYSNVFEKWDIVRIEPRTGCVEAIANLSSLIDRVSPEERPFISDPKYGWVLNGIAYDSQRKVFYVTGKNWRSIFTGRFVDQN